MIGRARISEPAKGGLPSGIAEGAEASISQGCSSGLGYSGALRCSLLCYLRGRSSKRASQAQPVAKETPFSKQAFSLSRSL